jgi:prepilin-type processing-associated H-X9-DG protein/prepilin-type N-terminal cleavage/methylation domain-containing protein
MTFRDRSSSKARAFTLVELLVVIGIIALLIGILLPSLSAARASSLKIKCAANMRSIGQTMQQYAGDFQGWVPRDYDPSQLVVSTSLDLPHLLWAEIYLPYLAPNLDVPILPTDPTRDPIIGPLFLQVPVYHCPSFPTLNHELDYGSNSWTQNSDDGVTMPNGSGVGVAQGMTKVGGTPRISETCFLIEANSKLPNDSFSGYDMKDHTFLAYDLGVANTSPRMLADPRHRGDCNILFMDGHVSSKPYKTVARDDFRTMQ